MNDGTTIFDIDSLWSWEEKDGRAGFGRFPKDSEAFPTFAKFSIQDRSQSINEAACHSAGINCIALFLFMKSVIESFFTL